VVSNALGKHLAPPGQQQFGIAQTTHPIGGIENYRRRHDGAEQRPAADFVDARNVDRPGFPGLPLITQRAAQLLKQAQFHR